MRHLRLAIIAALLAVFLAIVPVSAEDIPAPPIGNGLLYIAVEVTLTIDPVLREGGWNWVAGLVRWSDTGEHADNGVVTVILHLPRVPNSPNDEARAFDPAGFLIVGPDGTFGDWLHIPYVLWPDEQDAVIQGKFNVLSFGPEDPNPAFQRYGVTDQTILLAVTR